MNGYLGIDTSNYTTSVALYDTDTGTLLSKKKLLPVKEGEKGIRQSDAVFHHTIQLPSLINELFSDIGNVNIKAIGVSTKPCNIDNSYMPCFLTGIAIAESLSSVMRIPLYKFSHQDGHIMSALYSCDKLSCINENFFAFHISGGTSQVLLVTPNEKYFNTSVISESLDLKAGQAIDRVGIMLGLKFPCGPELEKLALKCNKPLYKVKIYRRDGNFSLSGIENRCKKMYSDNVNPSEIALYCLSSIYSALYDTVTEIITKYGNHPLVFSGGVMSNSLIKNKISKDFKDVSFASPEFSSDNAGGIAILSFLCND